MEVKNNDLRAYGTTDKSPGTNPNKALIALCAAAFIVPFMGSALNLALPEISKALSMNAVALTWVATSYLISTAVFQIPFARLADLIGRRKVFFTGIIVFIVCTLLCGFAPSGGILIALRVLSGIGSAMMFGTNMAILTSLFPPEKRGRALGINSAVVYAALAAGPFFGGIITHYLGWHGIFFVSAGMGLLVLILSASFLKGEWIESRGEKFDLAGSILYGVGLALLIFGFSSLPSVTGVVCLVAGTIAFTAFIFFERRREFPVFNVRLFSGNKVFALSSFAALINYSATSGIGFMMSLYLQYIRGFDARHAGFILIAQACIQSFFSLLAGNLSNRFEPSKLATAGMMIIVTGLVAITFVTPVTPIWMIVGILLLFGIGFGIFSSPNTNVIMSSVDKKDYTQASAATGTMRLTGQAVSMGIAGMAISFYVGSNELQPMYFPQFMQSMRMAFVVFLVLCVAGVYFSTARVRAAKHG